MLDQNLDVVLNFESEQLRDEFMMRAISSEDLDINDERVRYAGEKSVLLDATQADKLSTLTEKFGGTRTSSADSILPMMAPPRTYQEMVKSWDGLMNEIKRINSLDP